MIDAALALAELLMAEGHIRAKLGESTDRGPAMPLLCERTDHVATLTLSRPEARNAWDEDYNEGLRSLLPELEADRDVRCVILTGDEEGGAFSAGANLAKETTHTVASPSEFIEKIPTWQHFAANLISDFAKPTIAAVNGLAIGIGSIATYSCDLIVASERAEWRAPQVQLGVMPAYGGSPRLARWVGKGNAMRAALGWPIDADEAYRIGLAQWVAPHDELMDQAMEVATRIAGLPPLATRLAKESLNRGMDIPNIKDASVADIYRFAALSQTEDSLEAHRAWRERREPEIRGR